MTTATDAAIERRRMRVYVAGPISNDVFGGVWRGFAMGRQMFLDGLAPFVPHFDALFFLPDGNWNAYLEYDLEYILTTEALYRLAGDSPGADLETEKALELGIPVFYEAMDEYPELLLYAEGQGLRGKRLAHAAAVERAAVKAQTDRRMRA
jgi:hypothetical protein